MARKSRKNVSEVETIRAALYIRTALYVRLSVEDGNGRSNSIENQQLILNDYISDKPEFMVVDTYIDNGLSGMNFNRPSFQRMITDIEAGKIDCVIVKDLSRLGRNSIDTGYYIENYFFSHKVRFIAVTDQYDTASPDSVHGGIMLPLKNMVNEAYALDIGRKIKSAKHQQMLNGELTNGSVPYGYIKDPNNKHKLTIDADAAEIIKNIFEWFISGLGANAIAVKLNETGIKPPMQHKDAANAGWYSRTISRILKNRVYTGDMVQGKVKTIDRKPCSADKSEYIIVPDTHEPIISREIFDKAQMILESNAEKTKSNPVVPYSPNLFVCKMICSHCGKSLIRQHHIKKSGKEYYYFRCASKYRITNDACIGSSINESVLIEKVSSAIRKHLASLGRSYSNLLSKTGYHKENERLSKEKAEKQRELSKVQSLIRGLYENLVKGIITQDEYAELKSGYEKKAAALKGEINEIYGEIEKSAARLERYNEIKSSGEEYKKNGELNAELIMLLIERIEVNHDNEINIVFREFGKGRV